MILYFLRPQESYAYRGLMRTPTTLVAYLGRHCANVGDTMLLNVENIS